MIEFCVNNSEKIKFHQLEPNGILRIMRIESTGESNVYGINAADAVMLINFYEYIKNNDIQNDFINPNGKN